MAIYEINITKHNQQAHTSIDSDITSLSNGLFTFQLRVNDGNIVDYIVFENEGPATTQPVRKE